MVLFPVAVTFLVTWWFIQFVDGFFSPLYAQLGIDIFGKSSSHWFVYRMIASLNCSMIVVALSCDSAFIIVIFTVYLSLMILYIYCLKQDLGLLLHCFLYSLLEYLFRHGRVPLFYGLENGLSSECHLWSTYIQPPSKLVLLFLLVFCFSLLGLVMFYHKNCPLKIVGIMRWKKEQ